MTETSSTENGTLLVTSLSTASVNNSAVSNKKNKDSGGGSKKSNSNNRIMPSRPQPKSKKWNRLVTVLFIVLALLLLALVVMYYINSSHLLSILPPLMQQSMTDRNSTWALAKAIKSLADRMEGGSMGRISNRDKMLMGIRGRGKQRRHPRRPKPPPLLNDLYVRIGKIIGDGMDTTVDPCTDFYQFMVYSTCKNVSLHDLTDDIVRIYEELGGSPVLPDTFERSSETNTNPFVTMLKLQKYTGAQMVGDELMVAEKTQNYIFGFETDVLHLILGIEKVGQNMEKYLNATMGFASVMGYDLDSDWLNKTDDFIQRAKMLQFKISNICQTFQPIQAIKAENATLLWEAVESEFPMAKQIKDKIIVITKGCVVSSQISDLMDIMEEDREVVQAAAVGRFLNLFFNGTGFKSNWIRRSCAELMRILNEPIFQRIFITLYGPDTKTRLPVRALIEHIRQRLTNRIFELEWLDTYSKNRALNKINSIIPRIGYAPWPLQELTGDESFLRLLTDLRANQWYNEMSDFAEKKGARYTRFLANQNTFYVNAAYHAGENTINVQLGIMQPPMFDFGYPVPVMYGVLGFVIAHEITHSVDTIGMFFTLRGEQKKWVSDKSMDLFHSKSHCFVEQYSNFCFPHLLNHSEPLTACVNGSRVLSENIADDGGMKLSYAAYKNFIQETKNRFMFEIPGLEAYNNDQIFFMSVAAGWCETTSPKELSRRLQRDAHSPNPSRVNGTMQNFPPFAQAFKCPRGSPMNPVKKCSLW